MTKDSSKVNAPSKAQNTFAILFTAFVVVGLAAGGWYVRNSHEDGSASRLKGESPRSIQIGELTAQLRGEFKMPSSKVRIEFKDSHGQLVDVGAVKLDLNMDMPGMVMHGGAPVSGSGGRYLATIKPQMSGDWTVKISYSGPQGAAEKSFPITVSGPT